MVYRPRIRKIFAQPQATPSTASTTASLDCAFHITDAFSDTDLARLEALRQSLPLDLSRPTCPRRFVTEKEIVDECGCSDGDIQQQRQQDGWIGALVDHAVASWKMFGDHNHSRQLQSLPWYRFLEYSSSSTGDDAQQPRQPQHCMDRHTDGSNVHPATGARSIATMLLYLSTCRAGGETTLYHPKVRKKKSKQGGKQRNNNKKTTNQKSMTTSASAESTCAGENNDNIDHHNDGDDDDAILERVRPVYNTVLIFPHSWPHSGDPVLGDSPPKIALRVDLAWRPQQSR